MSNRGFSAKPADAIKLSGCDTTPRSYTKDCVMDWMSLLESIDAKRFERLHIVAHSQGAQIALLLLEELYRRKMADRVGALVLETPMLSDLGHQKERGWKRFGLSNLVHKVHNVFTRSLSWFMNRYEITNKFLCAFASFGFALAGALDYAAFSLKWPMWRKRAASAREAHGDFWRNNRLQSIENRLIALQAMRESWQRSLELLKAVSAPTLIVSAEHDTFADDALRYAEYFPSTAKHLQLECGHFAHAETLEFTEAVVNFLRLYTFHRISRASERQFTRS